MSAIDTETSQSRRASENWTATMGDCETKREEQRDTVKCLLEKQWKELEYRREREHKLAAWSMLLLGAAAAAIKAADPPAAKHAFSIGATFLVTLFGLFLIENRKRYEDTQQILARHQDILRAWDTCYWRGTWTKTNAWLGEALLPPKWQDWGEFGEQIMPRLDTIAHVGAIWITAATGIFILQGSEWVSAAAYALIPVMSFGIWLWLPPCWEKAMGKEKEGPGKPTLLRAGVLTSIFFCGFLWSLPVYWLLGTWIAAAYAYLLDICSGLGAVWEKLIRLLLSILVFVIPLLFVRFVLHKWEKAMNSPTKSATSTSTWRP